jgi:hypothetical protein
MSLSPINPRCLAELPRDRREISAATKLAQDALNILTGRLFGFRGIDRQEDFRHGVLRLLRRGAHLQENLLDLILGNRDARRQALLHQLLPREVRLDLVLQRRARDAVFVEHLVNGVDADVVLRGDALEILVEVVLRDLDVELDRFLKLQRLIDQLAQHLRPQTLDRIRALRARRHHHELDPLIEIVSGDDRVVDDRRRAHGDRFFGRADRGRFRGKSQRSDRRDACQHRETERRNRTTSVHRSYRERGVTERQPPTRA